MVTSSGWILIYPTCLIFPFWTIEANQPVPFSLSSQSTHGQGTHAHICSLYLRYCHVLHVGDTFLMVHNTNVISLTCSKPLVNGLPAIIKQVPNSGQIFLHAIFLYQIIYSSVQTPGWLVNLTRIVNTAQCSFTQSQILPYPEGIAKLI